MVKFTRINVFPKDYQVLLSRFSEGDSRPAQGILIQRALHYINKLEKEIDTIKEVVK